MAGGILTIGGRAFVRVGGGDAFAPGDECPKGTVVPEGVHGLVGEGSAFTPGGEYSGGTLVPVGSRGLVDGSAFAPEEGCPIGT